MAKQPATKIEMMTNDDIDQFWSKNIPKKSEYVFRVNFIETFLSKSNTFARRCYAHRDRRRWNHWRQQQVEKERQSDEKNNRKVALTPIFIYR